MKKYKSAKKKEIRKDIVSRRNFLNQEETLKSEESTLTGVAQWIERWLTNQNVAGLIPGQSLCLGSQVPQLGACKRQPMAVSLTH